MPNPIPKRPNAPEPTFRRNGGHGRAICKCADCRNEHNEYQARYQERQGKFVCICKECVDARKLLRAHRRKGGVEVLSPFKEEI